MAPELRTLLRNRTAVIGAGAGVVLVFLGWQQLRKTPASIVVAAPAGSADTGATDLSAYQAGAAAASSGFDTGAALGQAGIGLAGSVVGTLGDVAQTLAGSQADMGSTLSGALGQTIGALTTPQATPAITPTYNPPVVYPGGTPVPPAPSPTPTPTPTPTPAPAPTPVLWRLVFTSATPVYATKGGTTPIGTVYSMTATATQTNYNGAWWYQLTSARLYQGKWVRARGTFTATRI